MVAAVSTATKHGKQNGEAVPAPKPIISPPDSVELSNIVTGCKVYVERPQESESRKAEVLAIRQKKLSRQERKDKVKLPADEQLEYYVHYVEFNKRLDEWIPGARILLSREVEWPLTPQQQQQQQAAAAAAAQTATGGSSTPSSSTAAAAAQTPALNRKHSGSTSAGGTSTPASRENTPPPMKKAQEAGSMLRKAAIKAAAASTLKRKAATATADDSVEGSVDEDAEGEADEEMTPATPDNDADRENNNEDDEDEDDESVATEEEKSRKGFSKAAEIEKLRTQGSMTQSHSEISRVKNLDRIQMGKHEVEAWYFSPYPVEYAHTPVLYICEFCLCFFASEKQIERHRKKCTLLHPPGNEIYRHEDISFFEIDGRKQKTWCRNLCLLSKCFLDHKTLYYDVDPFLFYVMCQRDDSGIHLIGYFSKEKESAENYNVACILTLPQYQRMGFGKLLIEFSYELSKKEQKLGSPEKPLSDLGLLSYRAYWAETIVGLLLECDDDISIDEIANRTSITHADVMHTCQVLQLLKFSKGQHHLVVNDQVAQSHYKATNKKRRRIEPSKLVWKPPVFSRNDLRFGF